MDSVQDNTRHQSTPGITEEHVRASIARVVAHAESIWDEWAWQVENKTWLILGYESWDAMRSQEYGALASVTAPRASRPELVARFRNAGLTQAQTAETLGVDQATVSRHDHRDNTGVGRPVMQTHKSEPAPPVPTHRQMGEAELVNAISSVLLPLSEPENVATLSRKTRTTLIRRFKTAITVLEGVK
jgi:hypothetical protein